jgi:hypothetical protein
MGCGCFGEVIQKRDGRLTATPDEGVIGGQKPVADPAGSLIAWRPIGLVGIHYGNRQQTQSQAPAYQLFGGLTGPVKARGDLKYLIGSKLAAAEIFKGLRSPGRQRAGPGRYRDGITAGKIRQCFQGSVKANPEQRGRHHAVAVQAANPLIGTPSKGVNPAGAL